MEKAFLLARRENPLLLFRVTYARTYRVSGEALPGEFEIGDVGRDRNDEVHCVRVNHSFPHVVQLGLQSWKKKEKKQNKCEVGSVSIVGRPMINYGKSWTSRKSSLPLVFTRAPRVKRLPSSYMEWGGKGKRGRTLTRISFIASASEKLIVDSTIYTPTLINVPSSHSFDIM